VFQLGLCSLLPETTDHLQRLGESRVKPSAAVIVAVVQAYAKINASGEWIDKTENVNATNTKELFSRMNRGEMLRYAETGELPAWWPETLRRAAKHSSD
jgi:hypothetical protein